MGKKIILHSILTYKNSFYETIYPPPPPPPPAAFFLLLFVGLNYSLIAQNVHIPDRNFKNYLLGRASINTDADKTNISVAEAAAFDQTINVRGLKISDLTGIEAFTKISQLFCDRNNIKKLDLRKNKGLWNLNCSLNNLTSLLIGNNPTLNKIVCSSNQLTTLDLSQNPKLETIICERNELTSIKISQNNTVLKELRLNQNKLGLLVLNKYKKLKVLTCHSNSLQILDIKNFANGNLKEFDAVRNPSLYCLKVDNVASFKGKWSGKVDDPNVIRDNCIFKVTKIVLQDGKPTTITVKGQELKIHKQVFPNYAANKEVNWSVNDVNIATINSQGILKPIKNGAVEVTATAKDGSNVKGKVTITISNQTDDPVVTIPDAKFKDYLVKNFNINTNRDSEIQVKEANAYSGPITINNKGIADMTGIESFINFDRLTCTNNQITKLDLRKNTKLLSLICSDNKKLVSLNISNCKKLKTLDTRNCQLESLNVGSNVELNTINASNNKITNFQLGQKNDLRFLYLSSNPITGKLDVSNTKNLSEMECTKTQLTAINLKNGKNTLLRWAQLDQNSKLTCLQVDDATKFKARVGDKIKVDDTKIISTSCFGAKTVFVSKITITGPDQVSTKGDGTIQLKATVEPADATNKAVEWKVDDDKLATISTSGELKGLKVGTVTVTATAKDGSGKFGTKKVTITKQEVSVKKITITGDDKVSVGDNIQLEVTVEPADATNKAVEWKVNNDKLATISTSGELKALKVGTVTVTATAKDGSGVGDTKEVIITDKVTSVGDSELARGFTIYPNPANSHLTIDTEFTIKEIEVTDLAGKRIKSLEVNKSIDISTLPPNMYLLRVRTDSEVFVSKFVKE